MSTQHTPGPWRIHGNYIVAGDHQTICQWINYTDEPDARLIAAAPDMLAALKHAAGKLADLEYHWIGDKAELWGPIRAAIAKAEGTA